MFKSAASHSLSSATNAFFNSARTAFNLAPQGFKFANWELQLRSRSLTNSTGQKVSLTKTECALLLALLKRPRQIMSREEIMDMTETEDEVYDRAVDVQILRLRRKVEGSNSAPALLRPNVAQVIFSTLMSRF